MIGTPHAHRRAGFVELGTEKPLLTGTDGPLPVRLPHVRDCATAAPPSRIADDGAGPAIAQQQHNYAGASMTAKEKPMSIDNRPVLALADPNAAAFPKHDEVRAAAEATARRATNQYVALLAGHAATLLRELFGARAHRALFEQDRDGEGLISTSLLCVYDADDQVVWYDVASGLDGTDVVKDRDHDEATGGPVTAHLEEDSKTVIEQLVAFAQQLDWDDGWFSDTDLTLCGWDANGCATRQMYPGWLVDVVLPDEITFAADVRAILTGPQSTADQPMASDQAAPDQGSVTGGAAHPGPLVDDGRHA